MVFLSVLQQFMNKVLFSKYQSIRPAWGISIEVVEFALGMTVNSVLADSEP